jgi:hypothetical protein
MRVLPSVSLSSLLLIGSVFALLSLTVAFEDDEGDVVEVDGEGESDRPTGSLSHTVSLSLSLSLFLPPSLSYKLPLSYTHTLSPSSSTFNGRGGV